MNKPLKNVILVAASSWVSRIIVIIAQFASMRVLLGELGVSDYAAYVLATSIGSWVLLVDFGFGIALQNRISEKRVLGEPYNQTLTFAFLVSAGLLTLIVALGSLISPLIAPFLLTTKEFVPEVAIMELRYNTVLILFGFTALGGISYKVFFAEHKGYLANIYPAVAAILGLLLVNTLLPYWHGDGVAGALLLYSIPSCLIAMGVFLWLLINRWERPVLDVGLCKIAGRFWLIALMTAVTLQLDYLIMSRYLPAGDIVVYQLVTKIYSFMYFIFSAVLAALWPIFSEMLVRDDFKAVKKILYRFLVIAAFSTALFTFLFCFFRAEVAYFYFPGRSIPNLEISFLVLVGLYNMILLFVSVYSVALQSGNVTKVFLVWAPVQAFISVVGQLLFVERFGIYGIVIGLILSYVLVPLWLIPYTFKKLSFRRGAI